MNDPERRKLYRDSQRPQCCALLKLPFPMRCSRRASVERSGNFYCGLHVPRFLHPNLRSDVWLSFIRGNLISRLRGAPFRPSRENRQRRTEIDREP